MDSIHRGVFVYSPKESRMNGTCSNFWNSLDANMNRNPVQSIRAVCMADIVNAVREWRLHMQADNLDLSKVKLQADIALYDICVMVGMNAEEMNLALGAELAEDLYSLVELDGVFINVDENAQV
jgi:hypothetical protein